MKAISLALFAAVLACAFPCAGAADGSTRTVEGRVCDVFRDDVDECFVLFSLDCAGETLFAYCKTDDASATLARLEQLIGCDVRATGLFLTVERPSLRQHVRHVLQVNEGGLTVVKRPERGPFDVPDILDDPPELKSIDQCGPRKMRGTVIARWGGDTFLVRIHGGDALKVRLRDRRLPELNHYVEAVGKVTTDLYRYGLVQARWRNAGPVSPPDMAVEEMPLKKLFTRQQRTVVRTLSHGKTILVRGTLKSILTDENGACRLLLKDGPHHIAVDCSEVPEAVANLSEGCELSATGICVMDSECWHSDMSFPKISGLFLVPRTAGDIRVLRRPSWWTPARLAVVVVVLLAILAGILVWNASLRILVARKSRALLREQALKLTETLRIGERTRLAAELHDFHSQTLTAVAYRISSARNACKSDPAKAEDILTIAARMLKSCRTDLRRCLWDLRNDALDEPDFAKAIRLTVTPVVGTAHLSVRFAGRRAEISDSTAHTALSILRELAANGVNHGHATHIRIAGERLSDGIRFSVQDDGCGFDPSARPGQDEGHFGIDGIRERLSRLNGTLDIESSPGHGTYVRLTISHPTPQTSP